MSKKKSDLDEKVEFVASLIGDNFLRLAWALRELQDEQPDIFLKVVELVGLSPRKAYALARIARQFDGVAEERLHFIGCPTDFGDAQQIPEIRSVNSCLRSKGGSLIAVGFS